MAKDRLKFKGKGNEVGYCQVPGLLLRMLTHQQYKDLTRLLNFYQLWLDDLYPRAKFADALAIIEKLGHTKRMQTMRREWIDEGKPKSSINEGTIQQQCSPTEHERSDGAKPNPAGSASFSDTGTVLPQQSPSTPPRKVLDTDEELYTATPGAVRNTMVVPEDVQPGNGSPSVPGDGARAQPEEDELDMLLAEDAAKTDDLQAENNGDTRKALKSVASDDFEDEMEAMAGMDGMW